MSSNILYVCQPAHGHLDWGGVIETLQALSSKHRITVASGEFLKKRVKELGFDFLNVNLPSIRPMTATDDINQILSLHRKENFFNKEHVQKVVEQLLEHNTGSNAIIIGDAYTHAAPILANELNTPFVNIYPPYRVPNATEEIEQQANEFSEEFPEVQLLDQYQVIHTSPDLNLYFSVPELSEKVWPNTTFVGGCQLPSKNERSGIYYTSGTLFWDPIELAKVKNAMKHEKFLISAAGKVYYTNGDVEEAFISEKDLFGKLELIITQGGMGTVNKAIRSATPLVIAPLFFGNESHAKEIENYGNGLLIDQSNNYANAVQEVRTNHRYKKKAEELQKLFSSYGGSVQAAKLIEGVFT